MKDCRQFYIDGKWVAPTTPNDFPVTNPANEDHVAVISLGTAADVDKAVKAARKAFATFGETTPAERLDLLNRIIAAYQAHYDELYQRYPESLRPSLTLIGETFCEPGLRAEYQAFFAERQAGIGGGERTIAQTLESIDQCIAVRAMHQESLAKALR